MVAPLFPINFISKKMMYVIGTLLAVLILLLILTGCFNNDLSDRQSYRIGHDVNWTSVNLMGKERNVAAFSNDLLLTVASTQNLRLQLISLPPNQLLRRLENNEIDGVLTSMIPNNRNQAMYVFSEPYLLIGPVLVISIQDSLTELNEARRKLIAIDATTPTITTLDLDKDPSIQLRLYMNILQALADLDNHRIDGVILPALPAYIYTKTFYPGRLKVATTPLNDEGLRLVALKNERGETLIEKFNKGLAEIEQNGTYNQLVDTWGLVDPEVVESINQSTPEDQNQNESTD